MTQAQLVVRDILPQLQRQPVADFWVRRPDRLVAMLEALRKSEVHDEGIVGVLQHVAGQLAERVDEYGKHALGVFCTLARVGGPRAFRRMVEDKAQQLLKSICSKLGLVPVGGKEDALVLSASAKAEDAAELLCALGRVSLRSPAVSTALSSGLSERLEELDVKVLPELARALWLGDADFVLLHGICRRVSAHMAELDPASVVVLLGACGRFDLYDEEFLEEASDHLRSRTAELPVAQLSEALYALGTSLVRDTALVDALCEGLRPRVHELTEMDLVRSVRGLMKLRHHDEALLEALMPVIEERKCALNSVSLTNLISAFSLFDKTSNDTFFRSLLEAATTRMNRLPSTSVQHIFVALCRQQGRLQRSLPTDGESDSGAPDGAHLGALEGALKRLCQHLTSYQVAAQVTPVQAVSSLLALAKLHYRDLGAASVLTSVLVGRGQHPVWSWAPSAYFYKYRPLPEGCPFNEKRCLKVLQSDLDASHCVEVLQSLQWLDLYSHLAVKLVALVCCSLAPQLHELRAREVIIVARAFSAYLLPAGLASSVDFGGEKVAPRAAGAAEAAASAGLQPEPGELMVDRCFENLRRHEHFLEANWPTLQPFKLLCMEVDAGVFGPSRLCDVLNPMLLGFVDRLRFLTQADVEAISLKQQHREEDQEEAPAQGQEVSEDASAAEAASCSAEGVMAASQAGLAPLVLEHPRHRVVVGGHVRDFPVDVLIEARPEGRLAG